MGKYVKGTIVALSLALLIVLVVFVLQNAAPVQVQLFGWSFGCPLSLLIFVVLAVGFGAGMLYSFVRSVVSKSRAKRKQYVADLERENKELRAQAAAQCDAVISETVQPVSHGQ